MLTYAMEQRGRSVPVRISVPVHPAGHPLRRSGRREQLPSSGPWRSICTCPSSPWRACAQLEAEGYVHTLPRQACFVSRWSGPPRPRRSPGPAAGQGRPGGWTSSATGWTWPGSGVHLGPADPAGALRGRGGAAARPATGACPPCINHCRRPAPSGAWRRTQQILVGGGAEYLYLLLAQLLGREAVVAVEDPGYPRSARSTAA